MINIEQILGKPKDWKLTENEILDFIAGITNEKQLHPLFKRIIERDMYSADSYNPDTWQSTGSCRMSLSTKV